LLTLAYNPGSAYVEQVLPYPLQNHAVYTLSGWVADPDDDASRNGARFLLFAGTNLLGVVTNQPAAARTWNRSSLVYASGNAPPFAGQPLKIRVMHAVGNAYRVLIDGLTLDEEILNAEPPAPPANLTARLFGSAAVDLSWEDAGADVHGYRIERALGAGSFGVIGNTAPQATAFRDSCLPAATTCSYRVVATNALHSTPSTTVTIVTGAASPGAIAPESLANVADYGFLWWANGPGSAYYALKTSRYVMAFDWQALKPTVLFPVSHPAT
jgi:hypothetical protein